MTRRIHPRTLGRIRIEFYYLDDADHRPWVRQLFSLGAIPLRTEANYASSYVEITLDYQALPEIAIGALIPLYDVVVHMEKGRVTKFEFVRYEDDRRELYATEHVRFEHAPLTTKDLLESELQSPRTDPSPDAQDAREGKLDSGDAGLGNASPPVDGQGGVGPTIPGGGD